MNKTVNINLAGVFFHIDEDAYAKLQHYLDTIKRSLNNTQGKDEIIADIEARIAELFGEKIRNERQVISYKEVDEVITIMGQPEDYMVDEEIFEDEPSYSYSQTKTTGKQLFRDTDHSYVGGVSSGLAHYMGIESIWVRLLWVILTIASSGAFLLIYIALWIFVPEAKTTADKLSMRGEEVNISNIERKIREGFDDVAGKVKSVDYEKYGKQARSGATSAATGISAAILFMLNIFVKFIGIMILLVAGSILIGLFIALFTVGTFGIIDAPWTDYVEMAGIGAPLWLISLLAFFVAGIPVFFLFILGLKILVKNLKSLGTPTKLVLLGLWLLSLIGLSIIGVSQATKRAFDGEFIITENLPVTAKDTMYLSMRYNPTYASSVHGNSVKLKYDDDDNQIIYNTDIDVVIRSTKDSLGRIEIIKKAEGSDYKDARQRAQSIDYGTKFSGNELLLNSYLTTNAKNYFRDQKIRVVVYLPEGTTLRADRNTTSFTNRHNFGNILKSGEEDNFLIITEDGTLCKECPLNHYDDSWEDDDSWDDENEATWNEEDNEFEASITNENDSTSKVSIKIDEDGIKINKNRSKKVEIDKNGIRIQTD
ncbi:Phage shock protein PspC (stress-responsive transcriptional regulator) [Gillisia sp. Hel1_33_143]|uniref:PspC domain-containing protein n=1 Tax=Gillisia sp. Hel1_33_143 TaxID=1336796 RepID=UPI00087A7F5C|nr:PspC domain-containing protein [Gillisia sp. Hel1_33_143]SDS45931.1 Phage shock protein PspC (stress-responsive transcriptional regulator) [Gillisia sp. Hel1_33_143]